MSRGPQHAFTSPRSAAQELFPASRGYPALPPEADAPELEPVAVRQLIGSIFRQMGSATASAPDQASGPDSLDVGLHALKVLSEQVAMVRCSSSATTECPAGTGAAVRVEATSAYRGRDGPSYVFTYRIRITNTGAVPVQVVARGWDIRNADGSPHATVPRGSPGVVGQQPRLLPGNGDSSCFEYASGTTLATSSGTVEGTLQVVSLAHADSTDATSHFDAIVSKFLCDARDGGGTAS